ncbi:MAG: response regulator [Gammaproteobacteria bacterium]|jgi:DNA-binding response OmpR family regulator|nr:response regulator [Gammaproteobacteria bacterium]MBT3490077.1 response regulator [Gammaproteobacteria bacterium]MBT3719499.1 response regulator [Gammaproteobacteria bacterium]MBT3844011.1 response regulator [Gammaproteobacteria bacterium]MBT3892958.1 response regulator [Gammaproteobacteria bacterium]
MTDSRKVLVVDDDLKLRQLLCRYLNENGFEVDAAEDGREMDQKLSSFAADLIVLDLMLPGEDGLSIARRLQNSSEIPIIILSAKGDEMDRIAGLEIGADDYLSKPFNPRELLARIQSVLKRTGKIREDQQESLKQNKIVFGPFLMDLDSHILSREGETIALTSGEFELLRHLASRPNHVLSREQLLDFLDDGVEGAFDRSIDVRITRIRKKIESNPQAPEYIQTVRGVGYRFTLEL